MKTLTLELIEKEIPDKVYLYEIDYRDSLDDHPKSILKAVETNSLDPICELMDSNWEAESEAIKYYTNELKKDLIRKDFNKSEIDDFLENNRDDIDEIFYTRNNSNPIKDIIRNTSDQVFFYETGYYVDSDSWNWSEAQVRLERYKIKKYLGILNSSNNDKDIDNLILEASYGGNLVIYFRTDFNDLILEDKEASHICFSDPALAIIHTGNGSGSHCFLNGVTITLKFNRDSINMDKTIKYNYTFAVCGMSSDWCEGTGLSFKFEEIEKTEKIESETKALQKIDDEYAKTFKLGKCTPGDMDINRHRNTSYVNNFPCGTRCADCGTFWID